MARSDVEFIRALATRAGRDQRGRFFVEGERFVISALTTRTKVDRVFVVQGRHLTATLNKLLTRQHVRVSELSRAEFESVSLASEPSGVGAIVRKSFGDLRLRRKRGPWLCVESVRSKGNLGSALRTAAAFDASGLIVLGEELDVHDPLVVRATMGAHFFVPIVRTTPARLRRWCRGHGAQVLGTCSRGRRDLRELELGSASVLMLGHERTGMSKLQRSLCDEVVRIPISGKVDSLNLATATSVLLYETWWRRSAR